MPQGVPESVPDDGLTTNQRRNRPLLIVHTGPMKGKSTAAFGTALRGWNQGWSIGVYQFVKSAKWRVGEEAAFRALGRLHEQTGEGGEVAWHKMGEGWSWIVRGDPEDHAANAREGWQQIKRDLAAERHRMYVLDEFTYPMKWGWIEVGDVVDALTKRPGQQHVIITGRDAHPDLIAAAASGHGKTSVATGLLGALRHAGLTVSPHKVGPDYIDPGYHAIAAGRPGRNLDPWLVGEDRILPLFTHGATTPVAADIAVIEGVMGLFDGMAPGPARRSPADFASTAHVARLLAAPVVLVVDGSGMGLSAAALLHGFATFDPAIRLGGVIFNKVGTDRHQELLREAADSAGVQVLGVIRRQQHLTVPSRHLGLIPALELGAEAQRAVTALTEVVAASVDLPALLRLARTAAPLPEIHLPEIQPPHPERSRLPPARPRIALAAGRAFTFGYAEHPELLTAAGAEIVTVDPLRDERLPDDVDGLIIGGGFPEEHAAQLSANARLRSEVAALARSGAPVIAECAGLLYLARSLDDHPMCGVLDVEATMTASLTLGYRDAVAAADSPLAPPGARAHGHEFHRTTVTAPSPAGVGSRGLAPGGQAPADGGVTAKAWHWKTATATVAEGFTVNGVHASYLHLHWAGMPGAADRITAAARRFRQARPHA